MSQTALGAGSANFWVAPPRQHRHDRLGLCRECRTKNPSSFLKIEALSLDKFPRLKGSKASPTPLGKLLFVNDSVCARGSPTDSPFVPRSKVHAPMVCTLDCALAVCGKLYQRWPFHFSKALFCPQSRSDFGQKLSLVGWELRPRQWSCPRGAISFKAFVPRAESAVRTFRVERNLLSRPSGNPVSKFLRPGRAVRAQGILPARRLERVESLVLGACAKTQKLPKR